MTVLAKRTILKRGNRPRGNAEVTLVHYEAGTHPAGAGTREEKAHYACEWYDGIGFHAPRDYTLSDALARFARLTFLARVAQF